MPIDYRYEPDEGVLWGTASGALTAADFWNADPPDYPAGTVEILDARGVASIDLSAAEVRALAERERGVTHRLSRMAVVADSDVGFGVSRMFQLLTEGISYEIEVFRTLSDARAWLERKAADPG